MAEAQNTGPAPAATAGAAMGSAMAMGEISPFPEDSSVPDQSDDIASIFGLGEEAGPAPNSPDGASGGGASPPDGASAAEGGQGQAQPATPATSTPQPGQQGTSPQAPAPQPAPAPAPAAPPAAPASGTVPAPSQDPTVQALTAQVQALTAHIAQLTQGGAQGVGTQAPQPGQGDQPQQHPLMDYRLAMPDDVANAVFNEDPQIARQGLTHVINSIGREIHGRVIRQVEELIGNKLQSFGQQTSAQQQQERMRQEYFSSFPNHNDPATQLIVAQEAQVLWGANPALEWNENSKAALGARVNARLGLPQAQPQQQPTAQVIPLGQPQPQAQPVPTPAAQLGASPRPAANPQDNDSNFIEQILTA